MDRLVLSDAAWARMAPLIIGRPDQKGSTGRDNRMFVEGVLWIVRTGSPWRDLPEVFGDWNSVFRRFSRWSTKGVWWRIFEAMSDDPDFEYLIVDSTIVRAHQHAAGAKKGSEDQALGRSRGGLSTKIHMAVRGLGCPVRFTLTAGQKGDAPQAGALIEGLPRSSWPIPPMTPITCVKPSPRRRCWMPATSITACFCPSCCTVATIRAVRCSDRHKAAARPGTFCATPTPIFQRPSRPCGHAPILDADPLRTRPLITADVGAHTGYVQVNGLACPFCAYGIEKKFSQVNGVDKIATNIAKGAVSITMKEGATLDRATAAKDAGFALGGFEQVNPAVHK